MAEDNDKSIVQQNLASLSYLEAETESATVLAGQLASDSRKATTKLERLEDAIDDSMIATTELKDRSGVVKQKMLKLSELL